MHEGDNQSEIWRTVKYELCSGDSRCRHIIVILMNVQINSSGKFYKYEARKWAATFSPSLDEPESFGKDISCRLHLEVYLKAALWFFHLGISAAQHLHSVSDGASSSLKLFILNTGRVSQPPNRFTNTPIRAQMLNEASLFTD